jgi:hypothetical protein
MSFKKNKTKTIFQIFSLFLIIFGILFLLSFITTSNKDLKLTGYVGGIPPSQCSGTGTCDINECGTLNINVIN